MRDSSPRLRPGVELHRMAAALAADGDGADQRHRHGVAGAALGALPDQGPLAGLALGERLQLIRQPQQRGQILRGLGEEGGRAEARARGCPGRGLVALEQGAQPVSGLHVAELGAREGALDGLVQRGQLRLEPLVRGQRLGMLDHAVAGDGEESEAHDAPIAPRRARCKARYGAMMEVPRPDSRRAASAQDHSSMRCSGASAAACRSAGSVSSGVLVPHAQVELLQRVQPHVRALVAGAAVVRRRGDEGLAPARRFFIWWRMPASVTTMNFCFGLLSTWSSSALVEPMKSACAQHRLLALGVGDHLGVRVLDLELDQLLLAEDLVDDAAARPEHHVPAGLLHHVAAEVLVRREEDLPVLRAPG